MSMEVRNIVTEALVARVVCQPVHNVAAGMCGDVIDVWRRVHILLLSGDLDRRYKICRVHRSTVKELCARYLADLQAGLILGKGGRPKKPSTITTDTGRIERHIIPLLGTKRVKDLTKTDINKVLKDIMAGKTRVSVKTKKLRGKAIVRGGAGTATRTVGLLGGILTYAVEAGIIESNPAHGIRKPKDNVRKRRLSEAEYRILGRMLRDAAKQEKYTTIVDVIRQLALTGSRRSEIIGLKWTEVGMREAGRDRSAVHPVHLGDDGKTEGRGARQRRPHGRNALRQ
jgi:hypothetical protein